MRSLGITNIIQSRAGVRWHRIGVLLAIAAAASLLSAKLLLAVYAAAGDLDPSFGEGGKLDGVPGVPKNIHALAIQADGKLLTLSQSPYELNVTHPNCQLSRFNPDGSPDASFGVNGQRETDFGDWFVPTAIVIQQDGRIVVAGNKTTPLEACGFDLYTNPYSCYKIVLARYKTNGSLDSTFSSDGKVEFSVFAAVGQDMALQSNGKIVIAGFKSDHLYPVPINRSLLIRFNNDGTLDSSFSGNGYSLSEPSPPAALKELAIQENGNIVALQDFNTPPSRLIRYFANGERDYTFGTNGEFSTALSETGRALTLQPDGKIVMSIYGSPYGGSKYGQLVRLSADGILDSTFGQGGKTAADPSAYWWATSLQEDGRLVVADSSSGSFRLARYQSDGALDTSFGLNGTVTTSFSKPSSSVTTLALYGDGRIVVAGQSHTPDNDDYQPVMARYRNDEGTPVPADVRVSSATISPRTVYPGNFVTYTIPVTNYGPGKAAHLTFTAQTPANTVFYSFSAPPGWVVYQQPNTGGTGTVSCSAYELPAGSTVNFTLTVRVSPIVPPGTSINQVSSIKSFMPDPNIFNNFWTKTFTVQ